MKITKSQLREIIRDIGVTGWSKWVMKPFKVSPNSITSTTVKLANKFKSQLTSL
jgi:hypothetical protein